MKTILQNQGNRKRFKSCNTLNKHYPESRHGFTVDVRWTKDGPSYGPAFYVGPDRNRCPALPHSRLYRELNMIGYRIRVIPKGAKL